RAVRWWFWAPPPRPAELSGPHRLAEALAAAVATGPGPTVRCWNQKDGGPKRRLFAARARSPGARLRAGGATRPALAGIGPATRPVFVRAPSSAGAKDSAVAPFMSSS